MQHIIVHGKNNPYSDLYLIILMMCPCVPVVIYIPCVPVVICVPVSQFVISLWVSRSSFIFPVSRCPGRHLCPGVPVCNFYSNNPCVPVVIYISRLCPRRPRCSCVPVSRSSFIFPVSRSCPGRDLCPGVPVCNFSLRLPVVIYIPCVPVVICVPVSRYVISSVDKHDVSRQTTSWRIQLNPYNDVSRQKWRQSKHKHDVTRYTHTDNLFLYI